MHKVLCDVFLSMHISGKSLWELVAEQFEDLMVRILLLAACVSFVSTTQLIKKPCWPFSLLVCDLDSLINPVEYERQNWKLSGKLPPDRLAPLA